MQWEPLAQRVRQLADDARRAGSRRASLAGASTGSITIVASTPSRAPRPSNEGAGSASEKREYLTRVTDAARLVDHGRQLTALVLSRETSDRRFNGAQIIIVELEIEDPLADESPRVVLYEHLFGPATARSWKPGREIPIWVDPRDPDRIYAGR